MRGYIATLRADIKDLEEAKVLAEQDPEPDAHAHAHYHGHEKCTANQGQGTDNVDKKETGGHNHAWTRASRGEKVRAQQA
jgi:hypothetical protein